AIEPASPAGGKGRAHGEELGMGGGIAQGLHAVALCRHNTVALDDDGADRGLTMGGGFLGEGKGEVHGGERLGHGVGFSVAERGGEVGVLGDTPSLPSPQGRGWRWWGG